MVNLMNWEQWLFFKWGFFGNVWVWFHMAGGGIGAFACSRYLKKRVSMMVMFSITILWELIELIGDGGIQGMIDIYGSIERYLYDSLGDVCGAMFIAILVIYSSRKGSS